MTWWCTSNPAAGAGPQGGSGRGPPGPFMKHLFTLILGAFFAATGVGLLAGAYLLYRQGRRSAVSVASAAGVVVGLVERRGSRGGLSYAPLVRFSTERGQEIEFAATL